MATIVDARGKACPQPVIDTKNALKAHGAPVITLVDNDIARQNVEKMAAQMGLSAVSDTMEEGAFRIVIQPVSADVLGSVLGGRAEPAASGQPAPGAAGMSDLYADGFRAYGWTDRGGAVLELHGQRRRHAGRCAHEGLCLCPDPVGRGAGYRAAL